MLRPLQCFWILAALTCVLPPRTTLGQVDVAVERRLLEELQRDGKYKQGSLEAQRIEQSIKKGTAAKNGTATRLRIDLLAYREHIERLMGNLDAAERTLTEAERLFTDKDFQRWINVNAPRGDDAERIGRFWFPWSLLYFSLLDERGFILVDRIRSANQELAIGGTSLTADKRAQIVKWFKQLDELCRIQMAARSASLARLPEDNKADEARRPLAHMMLGGGRPRLMQGFRYLEASKLPFTLPADAAPTSDDAPPTSEQIVTETVEERAASAKRQLRRAIEYLERAGEDADDACEAALGRFEQSKETTPEYAAARTEATRIRAEFREPLAEALLLDGSLERARSLIDPLIADLRVTEKERHPALARPLILSARIALEQTRLSIATKHVVEAEREAKSAIDSVYEAKILLEMEDSEFDRSAPIHAALAAMIASSDELLRKSGQLVAAKDAADAAARRALQAIKANESRRKP